MVIEVTSEVLHALESAARRAHPEEACGILLGKRARLEGARLGRFAEAVNVHEVPATHFEIDPQSLINAYRDQRHGGDEVLGYFHSHPMGPAKPSVTDQEMAARDGKIWAIWGQGEVRFWRDALGGFEPLSYKVTEG